MDRHLIFAIALATAFHSDLGAQSALYGYILPAITVASMLVLFGALDSLLLSIAAVCFHFTESSSAHLFESRVLPIIALLIILHVLARFAQTGLTSTTPSLGAAKENGG